MRSTFTKVTAFLLSGALIFSANDVISFAKDRQVLREVVVADKDDEGNQDSSGGNEGGLIEKPDAPDRSGDGTEDDSSAGAGAGGGDSTAPLPSSDEVNSESDSSEDDSTVPDESEQLEYKITSIKIVDTANNEELQKDSDGKYYTSKNTLTAELDIVNTTGNKVCLEVNDTKFEDYDGESGTCSYSITLTGQQETSYVFKLINVDGAAVTETITLVYDATEPELQIRHMTGDDNRVLNADLDKDSQQYQLYTNNNTFRVELGVRDSGSGISAVQAKIGDKDVTLQNQDDKFYCEFSDIEDGQVITYTAVDKAGNRKEAVYRVCFNNQAPDMEIRHMIDGDNPRILLEDSINDLEKTVYTNETAFQVELEVKDCVSGVDEVYVTVEGDKVPLQKKNETDNIYYHNFSDVKNTQSIKYIVKDKAGNSKESLVYKVCLDCKFPEWITDYTIIMDDNKTISIEAKDEESGIKSVYLKKDTSQKIFQFDDADKKYKYSLTESEITLQGNEDVMNCTIGVEDKAGNKVEKQFNLQFDFTAPEIQINVNNDGDGNLVIEETGLNKVYYTTTNCTLKIKVEDKANGGYVSGAKELTIEHGNSTSTISANNGIIAYNIPCWFDNGTEMKKEYQITVKDKADNIKSFQVEIVYDTEAPHIAVDGLKGSEKVRYYNHTEMPIKITEKSFVENSLELRITDKNSGVEYNPKVCWDAKEGETNICIVSFADGGVYELRASCRDKLGNESHFKIDELVIDASSPVVKITYGADEEKEKVHYNKSATIQVTDKNFDESCNWEIKESGNEKNYKDIKWEKGEKEDTYVSTIHYEKEGIYQFCFTCSDKAGNFKKVTSEQIIVDHTKPQISVSFDDKKPIGGNVYKEARVATVTIKEQNFEDENVEIEWMGSDQKENLPQLSGWKQSEAGHFATIPFEKDGKYAFKVKCTDKAGNEGESQVIEEFIIDREAPVIKVEYPSGYNALAEDQFSKEAIHIKVTVVDDNFDEMSGLQIMTKDDSIEPKKDRIRQDGNVFVYDVSMQDDGEYKFDISARDKAGNETVQECVKDTIIDKTAPQVNVSFEDAGAKNEKYFSHARKAVIRITEKNFNDKNVEIEPVGGTPSSPAVSGWSQSGDVHTAEIVFDKDGVYGFKVKCKDSAGNSGESDATGEFVIDMTKPTVEIEYDKDSPVNEKYHNTFRTAKVIVTDENFDEKCTMKFDITSDGDKPRIGKWSKSKSDASGSSQYTCDVFFDKDGEYSFKFSCEDMAGNKSNVGNGGSFVIDTTRPEISVTYDNNNVKNGKYYNNSRTATITIKDKAFAENLVSVESLNPSGGNGLPAISGWTASGDTHTAKISFMEDGSYGFKVKCADLADNAAKDYLGEVFVIDRSAPEIVFGGVRKNSANNGTAAPTLKCTDAHLDEAGTQIILTGTNHGQLAGIAQKSAIKDGIQLVYPDFEHTQDMDDFYTLTVKAVDLAGNETEDELNFSINRFGSTYRISTDTQKLMSSYYIGKAPTITVTEINIDELEYGEVTISKDGQTVTLKQGSDYAVAKEGEEENWKSYTYSIKSGNFAKDGVYSVGFYSKDKASNTSDNRIKGKEIEFALDTTAPSIVADGIESGVTYKEKSREVTVDAKDNMFLTSLTVTDNGETLIDMSEKELAENGGIVTFTLDEADGLRDVVITATDKVNNAQKLEFLDVLITSKKEVITTIENEKAIVETEDNIVKQIAGTGIALPSYDDEDSLLYMVIEIMSAAVLITAVVTFYRKRRKTRN